MLLDDRCSSLNFLLAYVQISTVLSAQDTLKAFYSNNKINDYMISIKNNLEKRRDIEKKRRICPQRGLRCFRLELNSGRGFGGKVTIGNHWDPCPLEEVIRKCQRTWLPGQLPSARARSGSQSVVGRRTMRPKVLRRPVGQSISP